MGPKYPARDCLATLELGRLNQPSQCVTVNKAGLGVQVFEPDQRVSRPQYCEWESPTKVFEASFILGIKMRKLSIDAIFNYKKKRESDPMFYYTSYIQYCDVVPEGGKYVLAYKKWIDFLDKVSRAAVIKGAEFYKKMNPIDKMNANHYIQYRKGGYKNFIPSKPLIDVLSKIKVDVPVSQLKVGGKFYFELDGYRGIKHILTTCREDEFTKERQLIVTILDSENHTQHYFGINLDKTTLEECLQSQTYKSEILKNKEVVSVTESNMDEVADIVDRCFRMGANLFIYVSNPNEEFKEQYNQFSKDNKKSQREKLEYTSRPFIPIGDGVEFLRLVRECEIGVRGHFRWQPCGVGKTERKLIFIDPFVRNQKTYMEAQDERR